MSGESPERDWNALLAPPTIGEQIRARKDRRRRKWIWRLWKLVVIAIIAVTLVVWFPSITLLFGLPWYLAFPGVLVWVGALMLIFWLEYVILRWLERPLHLTRIRELESED